MQVLQDWQNERVAILGASRGLGAEFTERIIIHADAKPEAVFLSSRKKILLDQLAQKASSKGVSSTVLMSDFSNPHENEHLLDCLAEFHPTRIFYFAGGGPHGSYAGKQWKDHLWAFQVTFLTAAQVLHWGMNKPELKQIVIVGSAVAEKEVHPKSASYAAAKTALKNLVEHINRDPGGKNLDVRLFSPGYMDTDLLPKNADPRQTEEVLAAQWVADEMIEWAVQPEEAWHKTLTL